jgi:hypothetical protein
MAIAFRFVRRIDGLTYAFARSGRSGGRPAYRRVDLEVWCRSLPEFGWCTVAADGTVTGRPFDAVGSDELPPAGTWVSRKGDRSYVYDLVHESASAGDEFEPDTE